MIGTAWKYLKGTSEAVLTNKQIVEGLAVVLCSCHILLFVLSIACHMPVLTWLNVGSLLFCAGCISFARRGRLRIVVYACYADALFQVLAASVCTGFAAGFHYYLLFLIIHSYFLAFCFREEKHCLNPNYGTLLCAIVFLALHRWTLLYKSLYSFAHDWGISAVCVANFFVSACLVLLTMRAFLVQVRLVETRLKGQNRELEEMAKKDALTGLVNRRGLEESYQEYQEFQQSQGNYAVIMGDIDDFKKINDYYGHNVGDEVLQRVAEVIQNAVRSNDVVCRWGGEEIVIFLPECDRENAAKIAERVLDHIRAVKIMPDGKHPFQFTMTLGVVGSLKGEEFHRTVDRADERLYEGKRSGKNRVETESARVS